MSCRRVAGVLAIALSLSTCGGNGDDDGNRRALPQPTTGPYVSVAVDNHFHDVHPENHIEIAADRAFVIKNQGRNLHNLTVIGTSVSKDIKRGEQITFDPVGRTFPPGTYEIVCRYHGDQGMTGEFTVVDDG